MFSHPFGGIPVKGRMCFVWGVVTKLGAAYEFISKESSKDTGSELGTRFHGVIGCRGPMGNIEGTTTHRNMLYGVDEIYSCGVLCAVNMPCTGKQSLCCDTLIHMPLKFPHSFSIISVK